MLLFTVKLGFIRITGELSEAQYKKIRKMCNLLKWNRERINGFVNRQLGEHKAIETLNKSEANKVIEGLKGVSNGKKDRYKRLIAEVYFNNININKICKIKSLTYTKTYTNPLD